MKPYRSERVSEVIKRGLSEVFNFHRDEFSGTLITVTGVRPSKDLKSASIWISVYGDHEKRLEILQLIQESSGRIRFNLASRVRLKYVPELHFKLDESLDKADRIDSLLRESGIKLNSPKNDQDE
jgi:ribosome-binding factor A